MARTLRLVPLFLSLLVSLPSAQGEDNHVVVVNDGVEEAYAKAIETLVTTARDVYVNHFKLPMPDLITVELNLAEENELRLFTDGQSTVHLRLASMKQLLPARQSGVFNIYGFCHELGHIAMYHRLKRVAGINSDVAEAWAHLCGSLVCDRVFKKHGKKLWPKPFDYKRSEGTPRLRKQVSRKPEDDFSVASRGFWKLYLLAGKEKFFKAFDLALADKPTGGEFLPRFLEALSKTTKKKRLPEYFPKRMLRREFAWSPGPPNWKSKSLFKHLRGDKVGGGTRLRYHPDELDPKSYRSIGGTGYLQFFKAPDPKGGKLIRVELYGCRYGSRASDNADVVVWICDEKMGVLKEHKFKYKELNWGRECAWFKLPGLKPAKVPGRFFVGVFFDATATKGYFMGFQKKVTGHSYTGTPDTGLELLSGQDWVMRVTVK